MCCWYKFFVEPQEFYLIQDNLKSEPAVGTRKLIFDFLNPDYLHDFPAFVSQTG